MNWNKWIYALILSALLIIVVKSWQILLKQTRVKEISRPNGDVNHMLLLLILADEAISSKILALSYLVIKLV